MSRRSFSTDKYHVTAGWDRPLQYYFLTIEDPKIPEGDDTAVFDNLRMSYPAMNLSEINRILSGMGIEPPNQFFRDLISDQTHNVGNVVMDY